MPVAQALSAALKRVGQEPDDKIALGETALLLAGCDQLDHDLAPYRAHLKQLADDCMGELAVRGRSAQGAAISLAQTIAMRHGYFGDTVSYDDMVNADLIGVINRKRGLPVAIGILYLETAHRLAIEAQGLNAPGHFVVRIGPVQGGVVIDPFNGGIALAPSAELPAAEPFADPADLDRIAPLSRREVLLRLLNNIFLRAARAQDDARALAIIERMVWIAPARADLWFEQGRLSAAMGSLRQAISSHQKAMDLAGPNHAVTREASLAIAALKTRLN